MLRSRWSSGGVRFSSAEGGAWGGGCVGIGHGRRGFTGEHVHGVKKITCSADAVS